MPLSDLDDKNQASTSSDDAALDDAANLDLGNDGQDGADGASSSDARGDNTDQTTLDIVRDVVGKDKDGAASPAEGEEGKTPAEGEDTGKPEDDEEYSDVPFNKHPRFQKLIKDRNALRADATRHRNVQAFMDQNGISAEEASDLFVILAASKSDPRKAWEMAKPLVQQLLIAAGEVLPEDLQKRVADGELTAEAAAEVSRSRAQVKAVETGRSFEQQRMERSRAEALSKSLYDTATGWVADRRKKDPNFDAKEPNLKKEIAWLQSQEGQPSTPEGVRDQLERAYKAIVVPTTNARPGTPAPTVGQGTTRRISSASGASGTAQPKPQTTMDIIRQVKSQRQG